MNTTDTQAKVDANCNLIRQLRWLQSEQRKHYDYEISKLVAANEELLKHEAKTAQNVSTTVPTPANR